MSAPEFALAITVHVGAMLAVMAVVALVVYDRLGIAVLRKAWLNSTSSGPPPSSSPAS